jgi:hypothetical protein
MQEIRRMTSLEKNDIRTIDSRNRTQYDPASGEAKSSKGTRGSQVIEEADKHARYPPITSTV